MESGRKSIEAFLVTAGRQREGRLARLACDHPGEKKSFSPSLFLRNDVYSMCAVEQRLARQAHNLEVVGSIPAGVTCPLLPAPFEGLFLSFHHTDVTAMWRFWDTRSETFHGFKHHRPVLNTLARSDDRISAPASLIACLKTKRLARFSTSGSISDRFFAVTESGSDVRGELTRKQVSHDQRISGFLIGYDLEGKLIACQVIFLDSTLVLSRNSRACPGETGVLGFETVFGRSI